MSQVEQCCVKYGENSGPLEMTISENPRIPRVSLVEQCMLYPSHSMVRMV